LIVYITTSRVAATPVAISQSNIDSATV
jgi:hypothetical protein